MRKPTHYVVSDDGTMAPAYADDDLGVMSPATTGDGGGTDYMAAKKAGLEAEVATRNAGRDEADHIKVDAPGNKPELAAALAADDAATAAKAAGSTGD